MAEKKIVANFQIEAQSAKQELESLRAAEEKFIQGGNTLATDLTQNFGEIEQAVGKAFDKIESSGKVSQSQFDAIVAKLATMKEAIENAGVPLDQIPEQFTKALATAETQVAALAGGMDAARSRTESLRDEFAKAGQEAKELAENTKSAGEKIKDAAERADGAFEKFARTMVENPKEALEQFPRLAGAVIQLRQEIERTQKSGGVVDQQDIARLKQFENQLELAKNEARTLKIEIDKASAGINDASQSWQGFDGVLNNVAGRFGKVGVGAIGAWAAIREGWQVGQQLNQLFGTDMSEWDKSIERFGAKANLYITRTFDSIMAGSQLLLAVLSGDVQQIKQAYAEAERAGEAFKQAQSDIIEKWGADWDLAHPRVKKTTDAVKENTAAVKENTETWTAQADAMKKAFEDATKDRIQAHTDKINEQIKAAFGLAEATDDLAKATADGAAANGEAETAASAHVTALQKELAAVQDLLALRGVYTDSTEEVSKVNLDAGVSTDFLLMKQRSLQEELAGSVTSWSAAKEATTERASATAELAAVIEKEKAAQQELTTATIATTVSRENGQIVIKNTTDETGKLVGVLENGKVVYTNLTDAQQKAAASGITFGESAKNIKQPASEAAAVLLEMHSATAGLRAEMDALEGAIDRVNKKMAEMKSASKAAAGEEGEA